MDRLSDLAESMVGSEIVKLSTEINQKIAAGNKIYNYTIGDFSSKEFPIPQEIAEGIKKAIDEGHTNYPPGTGVQKLRESVSHFIKQNEGITYTPNQIQIASGGRPLIYSLFRTLVNRGDKVIYATPSWNNNHYVNLNFGEHCVIHTKAENNFMPKAEDIAPFIKEAVLLSLCTPQNPTGTTVADGTLKAICDLVVTENEQRKKNNQRLLYVLFDQMYFTLTYGDTKHYNPVVTHPAMKNYTIMVDGVSKAFAGTGLRVGWACGPEKVIAKMGAFLSHIGAWAPTAEQYATADFLQNDTAVNEYLKTFKSKIESRLSFISENIFALKEKGYSVDCIAPQAAIYLTIKVDLKGKKHNGKTLETQADVTSFLIDEVGLAMVPFGCFGADKEMPWYRMSVGTSNLEDLKTVFTQFEKALQELQ